MRHSIIFAAVLAACSSTWAQVTQTLTQAGFTGILASLPNARLLDWGRAEFAYRDHQIPGIVARSGSTNGPSGDNFVLGFGLLPNLESEQGGSPRTSLDPDNCFVNHCTGIRDLSAGGKLAIGIDARNRFRVGLGATDFGGAATNFRSYYGVLTYDAGCATRRAPDWPGAAGFNGINGARAPRWTGRSPRPRGSPCPMAARA